MNIDFFLSILRNAAILTGTKNDVESTHECWRGDMATSSNYRTQHILTDHGKILPPQFHAASAFLRRWQSLNMAGIYPPEGSLLYSQHPAPAPNLDTD